MLDKTLFFFSGLGVFNAFVLGLYLMLAKKHSSKSNTFLSLLLFFLVIRVGVSCFYFFGPLPIFWIKLGLVANLFVGPTILSISWLSQGKHNNVVLQYAIQLSFLVIGVIFAWILYDFDVWDHKIRHIIHSILSVYLIWSAYLWRKELIGMVTSKMITQTKREGVILFLAVTGTCAGFVLSLKTTYILGPLIFSLILYFTFAFFLINRTGQKKSYHKKIQKDEFDSVYKKLMLLMESESLHRDADLNLGQLAENLSVTKHFLSQILNDNLGKSFYQFVNEYRIEEACLMLRNKKPYKMETIGYEVGFRSRSSFFSAFRKLKGMTPSQYREKV